MNEIEQEEQEMSDNVALTLHTVGKLFYRVVVMIILFSLYNHTFGETTGLVIMGFMMSFAILFLTLTEIMKDIDILESKYGEKPTNKNYPSEKGYILMHEGMFYTGNDIEFSKDINDANVYKKRQYALNHATMLEEAMGNKSRVFVIPTIS